MARFSMGGDWAGHYVDPFTDRPEGPIFGVTARLVEIAESFDGSMTDLEPVYEIPFNSYLLQLDLEAQRQMRATMERFQKVSIRMRLPERSRLAGRWRDETVEFVKSYDGAQTAEWLADGKVIDTQKIETHRVHYKGRLDQNGRVLDGKWTIRAPGLVGKLGKPLAEGTFHLVRQSS